MEQTLPTRFFLGANSKCGFYSLYDSLSEPAAGDFLWVLKGGPGCGKSTFMKRIGAAAEAAGAPVEYVHCSGDPASLDAVRLPAQQIAYVDGTAPHIIEGMYPGAASLYLDLGSYFDAAALSQHLDEIAALNRQYKACYADAYALLAAASALLPKNAPSLWGAVQEDKLERRIAGFCARELHRQNKKGKQTHRFPSAWSCEGYVSFAETLLTAAQRVYLLDNEAGLGHVYLAKLAAAATAQGYDTLLCHDPLEPEKPEALFLPERSLLLMTDEAHKNIKIEDARHLRLDILTAPGDRGSVRRRRRESEILLHSSVESLAAAKSLHDALEAIYHPHVDFSGVNALANDHIAWLFA